MNEMELLRKLAVAARREQVPAVDVSTKMATLLSARQDEWDSALAWIAGLSLAAALPAVIVAVYALDAWTDPLHTLFFNLGGMLI
jgi:hypothetical protein